MVIPRKAKVILALIPFALILLVGGYEGILYKWNRGWSVGTRTGIIRRVSVKGPPYCKYLYGEMLISGQMVQPEIFEFSVDDDADTNPVVIDLHAAEKKGDRVTVHYRQDRGAMFRCTPSENVVTQVEK